MGQHPKNLVCFSCLVNPFNVFGAEVYFFMITIELGTRRICDARHTADDKCDRSSLGSSRVRAFRREVKEFENLYGMSANTALNSPTLEEHTRLTANSIAMVGTTEDKKALAPGCVRSRISRRSFGLENVGSGVGSFSGLTLSLPFPLAIRGGIADDVGATGGVIITGAGSGDISGGEGIWDSITI